MKEEEEEESGLVGEHGHDDSSPTSKLLNSLDCENLDKN